ncbi:MAG TPA: hypothetical protein DIW51_02930, partial [Rhodospirillaceae bacterium]|nr:hypothetical protein [Rhodospirillaceae bacterium]
MPSIATAACRMKTKPAPPSPIRVVSGSARSATARPGGGLRHMALKSSNRGQVPPFIVMDVMRAAEERERAGEKIFHLEVGQPGTSAPSKVIEAARQALDQERIGYTNALGMWGLREAIARHYGRAYGVAVDAEDVVVTTGSSGGFVLSFMAAFDPGDRVALASPGYPAYRNILTGLGVEVIDLPTTLEDNFQPTVARLKALDQDPDGLIVASPSNPAGTMIAPAEFKALVDHCRERGIRLISDEIYHGITYGVPGVTALAHTRDAVVINSFSKYFGMTGWRLGWLVAPEAAVEPLSRLAQNVFLAASTPAQHAALAAFTPECEAELERRRQVLEARRGVLLAGLECLGLAPSVPPQGAFYVWLDISHLSDDSEAFCRALLEEENVAITPG